MQPDWNRILQPSASNPRIDRLFDVAAQIVVAEEADRVIAAEAEDLEAVGAVRCLSEGVVSGGSDELDDVCVLPCSSLR